jgi:hypothetical protein
VGQIPDPIPVRLPDENMADEKQLLWNHYQQLSEEIKAADILNYQIIGVVVAAVVALLNAAFSKASSEDRCWILMSVFAVTIPGRFLLELARRRIWRIASYLEVYIEPVLQVVKWQHRLNDKVVERGLRTNSLGIEFWLIFGLDLLAGALVIATVVGLDVKDGGLFMAFALIFVLHSLIRAIFAQRQLDRGGTVHRQCHENWEALQRKEKKLASETKA